LRWKIKASQQIRCNKIAGAFCLSRLGDDIHGMKPAKPGLQGLSIVEIQSICQFPRRHTLADRQTAQGDTLALCELKPFIHCLYQMYYRWIKDAALDNHLHPVHAFFQYGSGPALGEQTIIDQIKTAALTLHKPEVVENPCQFVVASSADMEDVDRCHAQGQTAWVNHLQTIGVQVEKDISPLGVGPMHQGIDQQFAHTFSS